MLSLCEARRSVSKRSLDFIAEPKVEQETDEKNEYCAEEFDNFEDKHKVLTKSVADLESAVAESEEGITTTKAEIVLPCRMASRRWISLVPRLILVLLLLHHCLRQAG